MVRRPREGNRRFLEGLATVDGNLWQGVEDRGNDDVIGPEGELIATGADSDAAGWSVKGSTGGVSSCAMPALAY